MMHPQPSKDRAIDDGTAIWANFKTTGIDWLKNELAMNPSKARANNNQQQKIISLLECPICLECVLPPIYQSQNEHLICKNCCFRTTLCPVCQATLSALAVNNLQLGKLANIFHFGCKYVVNGCQWKSILFMRVEHEKTCEYIVRTRRC